MNEKLAYAVGPQLPLVRDITLGDLLREAAETVPDRTCANLWREQPRAASQLDL